MSAPATADWSALLRLARYLVVQPRAVYDFPWQDEGVGVRTLWAQTLLGAFALGDPRVGTSACVVRIRPSI
eukprot:3651326-Alexandrium_andersonii.AAC.1